MTTQTPRTMNEIFQVYQELFNIQKEQDFILRYFNTWLKDRRPEEIKQFYEYFDNFQENMHSILNELNENIKNTKKLAEKINEQQKIQEFTLGSLESSLQEAQGKLDIIIARIIV